MRHLAALQIGNTPMLLAAAVNSVQSRKQCSRHDYQGGDFQAALKTAGFINEEPINCGKDNISSGYVNLLTCIY